MIRADDLVTLVVDDDAVPELGAGSNIEFVADRGQRETSETNDHLDIAQHREFTGQVRRAIFSLAGCWLVVGWRAPNRRRDPRVLQRQAVVARNRLGLRRQACLVHRPKQPIAASITGENSSGSIRAVSTRRKTQNQNFCANVAEAGDRFAPISLGRIRSPLLHRDFLSPLHQTTALAARRDLAGEFLEISRQCHIPRLFAVPIV